MSRKSYCAFWLILLATSSLACEQPGDPQVRLNIFQSITKAETLKDCSDIYKEAKNACAINDPIEYSRLWHSCVGRLNSEGKVTDQEIIDYMEAQKDIEDSI